MGFSHKKGFQYSKRTISVSFIKGKYRQQLRLDMDRNANDNKRLLNRAFDVFVRNVRLPSIREQYNLDDQNATKCNTAPDEKCK